MSSAAVHVAPAHAHAAGPDFLSTMLANLARRGPLASIIEMHGAEPREVSGHELAQRVARARGFLRRAGVQVGDRVALLAPNSASWLAVDLAILAEGAVCVPLYARQAAKELAAMLADCTPSLLIGADEELAERVAGEARAKVAAGWRCAVVSLEEVLASEPVDDPTLPLAPDHKLTLIYTSGTSGEAKGVVYTAQNVAFMLPITAAALDELTAHRSGEDRVFHYLPLCFAGSRIAAWTQLLRGNPLWLSTNLDDLVQELGAAKPHYFLNVPALLERVRRGVTDKVRERGGLGQALLTAAWKAERTNTLGGTLLRALATRLVFPKLRAAIGENLEFLICGSAPLSEETQRWFEMIGIPVYQVYGLTESTGIITMDKPGRARAGCVGTPIAGVEVKLGDEGELLCRGPHVFSAYWQRPEATADMVRNGWLHTGDRAELDAEGRLRILGRTKNILVPESGHNVAPEPLEEALLAACPALNQAVVVGHGRPFLATIVSGAATDAEILAALAKVNAELPHYKRIRRFIRASDPFSPENGLLTANQKLKRASIEQRYARELAEVYA